MFKVKKYSGAGNRFLMINNLEGKINVSSELVKNLIAEKGPEMDGIIFIEASSIADYKMNYYNKDGTGNALCGNGLRCTARFLKDEGITCNDIVLIEGVSKLFD